MNYDELPKFYKMHRPKIKNRKLYRHCIKKPSLIREIKNNYIISAHAMERLKTRSSHYSHECNDQEIKLYVDNLLRNKDKFINMASDSRIRIISGDKALIFGKDKLGQWKLITYIDNDYILRQKI